MNLRRIILLSLIALLAVAGIVVVLLLPTIESISPTSIPGGLPNVTSIEIVFNRRMDRESVIERLSFSPEIEVKSVWNENTLRLIPMEIWPSGAQVEVSLAAGARSRLRLPLRQGAAWSFQIAPVQLAYLWPADGDSQLYLLDPTTGETLQLTDGAPVLSFRFGPDGQSGVFFAENNQGGSDLFSFDRFAPAETLSRLLSCQRALCSDPAISPDGSLLAYTRNDREVWLLTLEAAIDPEQISPEGEDAYQPAWSETGLLSYFNADRLAYTVTDLNTGQSWDWDNQSGELAAWSPGGSALVAPDALLTETDILRGPSGEAENEVVSEEELEPVRVLSSQLMVYQNAGEGPFSLTDDPLAEDFSPAFSPNGRTLAFTRRYLDEERWTPGRQIWLMSLPGGIAAPVQAKAMTEAPDYLYTALSWHPDGNSLAAVRFDKVLLTEPPEIWLLALDGSAIRLVIGGYQPQWLP